MNVNFLSSISLERFLPEPEQNVFRQIGQTAASIANYAGSAARVFQNAGLGEYQELLQAQTEAQLQLMQVSLQSNLSRTEHETQMAAVRNLRVA